MLKINFNYKKAGFNCIFFICLLYILMRPVLITYITPVFKYLFILTIIITFMIAISHKKIITLIGFKEIICLILFYVYVVVNSWYFGDSELLYYGLERYIFLTLPIFIIPLINTRINWLYVLKCLTAFGIIDSLISIYEFITYNAVFPLANISEDISIQMSNYKIIRTYGLNGNYFLLAEILCVCGFAAYYLYKFEKKRSALFALVIISIGVLTTGSRGYYVAYMVGLLVLYISEAKYHYISQSQLFKVVFIILIALLALWFLLGTNYMLGIPSIDTILTRMRQIFAWTGEDANEARLIKWQWSSQQWKNSFWFGYGACSTDTRYSGFISVTESGLLKRLVELGLVGTVMQYYTFFHPLIKGLKEYNKAIKKNPMVIFFLTVILCFLVEDLILQRYTELEYTIILWCSVSYISYCQKDDAKL